MDSNFRERGERGGRHRWLYIVVSIYTAVFLVYAETIAFTSDEGYHLLTAQLIGAGKTPYLDFCFPQTPLNAYWNALLMRILGGDWRGPHLFAALFTISAVLMTVDYVRRRFPVDAWRQAGAIAAAVTIGLNGAVFAYGPLQAYGICLAGLTAAFRLAVRAVARDEWWAPAGAGLCAGVAAASSLLSAAASPVLLGWMLFYQRPGRRWKTLAAFALALSIPFVPVFWLFARGPRQTWFNLFRYHVFFRRLYWPETTRHDLEVLTSWIDNGQALILGLLALSGLVYVVRRSAWPRALKAEFYLCAWMAGALAAEVGRAHPTFTRYFLLTVPFLAVLAVAGLYSLARAFEPDRPRWLVPAVALLMALGLGKTLYERRELDTWSVYQRLAAKVNQVTPPNAPILTAEPVYFLTHRTPPSGYELSYTHLVNLAPEEAALMHILNNAAVKRQVQSGMFATVYSCDEDEISGWGLPTLYRQHVVLENCDIFWDRKR